MQAIKNMLGMGEEGPPPRITSEPWGTYGGEEVRALSSAWICSPRTLLRPALVLQLRRVLRSRSATPLLLHLHLRPTPTPHT